MTEAALRQLVEEKLCDIAEAILAHYDPCSKRGSACRVADPNPCCLHTRFGENGCPHLEQCKTRTLNASCAIWLCDTAAAAMGPDGLEAMKRLERVAEHFGLMHHPFIGETYYGADRPTA